MLTRPRNRDRGDKDKQLNREPTLFLIHHYEIAMSKRREDPTIATDGTIHWDSASTRGAS